MKGDTEGLLSNLTSDKSLDKVRYIEDFTPKRYIWYSTVAFFSLLSAGFFVSLVQGSTDSTFLRLTGKLSYELPFYKRLAPLSPIEYFAHNGSIFIATWFTGLGIIGPFIVLWENAMNIGGFLATGVENGDPSQIAFIIPHGIFEIPALIISLSIGFYVARVSFDSVVNDKRIEVASVFWSTFGWAFVGMLLLLIAAFVESTISPEFAKWVGETLG